MTYFVHDAHKNNPDLCVFADEMHPAFEWVKEGEKKERTLIERGRGKGKKKTVKKSCIIFKTNDDS